MKKLVLLLSICFFATNFFGQIEVATENFNLAKKYTAENNFEQAKECYNKASSIFKKEGQMANYVISELSLSELLINISEVKEAAVKLDEILPVAIENFTEKSKVVAHIYSLKGRIAYIGLEIDAAKIFMSKALSIKIELFGEESIEAAMNMNDLALIYSQTGEIDSAIYYYEKNISIIKMVQGENSELLPTAFINLSNLYITLGRYDEAIEMKNRVIEIVSSTRGENTPEVAEAYGGLGNAYIVKGEYKTAEDYLLKSNNIYTQIYGEDSYKIAVNYINLGNIYNDTENYEYALQYYFLATKIFEKKFEENPELAGLYNNIGLVCLKQGNYTNAEIFFNKALDVRRKTGNENNFQIAVIYSNLGSVYRDKQDTVEAINNYNKSIDILTKLYGEHNPNLVNPLLNMANIYFSKGDIEQSLQYFQKSLVANSKFFKNYDYNQNPPLNDFYDGIKHLEAINGKVKVYYYMFKQQNNFEFLNKAMENIYLCDTLITDLRKSLFSHEDKIRLNSEIANVFDYAVEISYSIYQKYPTDENLERIFYFTERNKTSSLLQAIVDSKAENFANVPDSLLKIEQWIKNNINSYNQKIAEATSNEEANFYRKLLFEENTRYQEIIAVYQKDYPAYYNAKFNIKLTTISDIKKNLDENTAIINYYMTPVSIFAFIIIDDQTQIFMSEFNDNDRKTIKEYNEAILSYQENDIKKYQETAFNLYESLFFFILPDRIEKLVIIPDDIIGSLSFDAILTEKYDGELKNYAEYPFLIKKYNISYSYSATLLTETQKIDYSKYQRDDILTIAPIFKPDNPQFFDDNQISTIPGSETEAQNIDNNFKTKNFTSELMLNNNANEYLLKNVLGSKNFSIIHIATHGFVNFENPELSALILSNDKMNIEDGILYSGEIYNMTLKTDLITLSACETARGVYSKGEGVIGLSRAFMYAGAKNLIISLWKVADIPTTELMTNFYDILLQDNSKIDNNVSYSEALYKAKLKMIGSKYSHPFFWSSFILIGQ